VEHVGSLLRPPVLRDARAAYARGEIAPAEFKMVEVRREKRWEFERR
jgi:methionine synthase II (cobalamin-independent)